MTASGAGERDGSGSGSPESALAAEERKRLGSWYTPPDLVDRVVDNLVTAEWLARREPTVRVIDPACGDGRFLVAVLDRVRTLGGECDVVGIDVDRHAVAAARSALPGARIEHADALRAVPGERFDLVIGNPPFLSQMATRTTRGGASPHGGGPYADVAVEFLALAVRITDPEGGRIGFVLPQSVLSARDAAPVRQEIDDRASMVWSWSSDALLFDARVRTCALGFELLGDAGRGVPIGWTSVVNGRWGVPAVPEPAEIDDDGTLGQRARLNANFRDEYYGMVPAVGDHDEGPPLVTSGLIDPGRSRWGERPVRFAKRRYDAPRFDLDALDADMRRWAARRLVPKVLVANQTPIIEAVCDPQGAWLPGVPVVGVYPRDADASTAWAIAAVLTSPFASAWAWQRCGGSGLAARTIRVGPAVLADLPWPRGDLSSAVRALQAGDVRGCGSSVDRAFGVVDRGDLTSWWCTVVERLAARAS